MILFFQPANPKAISNKYVLAQIAVAEESARLRRKEKREKKRMELSKYLGINAWKCDQVSISSAFCAQIFRTNIVSAAFL